MTDSQSQTVANNAKSTTDVWFGVQDARARKIIQDRLAQRARRKRLAEHNQRPNVTEINHRRLGNVRLAPKAPPALPIEVEAVQSDITIASVALETQATSSSDINPSTLDESHLEDQLAQYQTSQLSSATSIFSASHPNTDPYFINMPSCAVFSALFNNSRLLGISCLHITPRQSPPVSIDIPLPLHPIPLQQEVCHHPYIDCLPIPKLRYNLILFDWLIDDWTFCNDLILSSNLISETHSWDPSGWVISEEFKKRWAVLFDDWND